MKERPILFSAPMVRKLLDGTKTQTRRVACFAAEAAAINWVDAADTVPRGSYIGWVRECDAPLRLPMRCPYGVPGDRLWVRETIRRDVPCVDPETGYEWMSSVFAADGARTKADAWPWKRSVLPAIHCPRGLSRITLELTDVRVQRLHDIDELDSLAEGVPRASVCGCEVCSRSAQMCPADAGEQIMAYAGLWDSINGKRPGCSWEANPWVWAISFRPGFCEHGCTTVRGSEIHAVDGVCLSCKRPLRGFAERNAGTVSP